MKQTSFEIKNQIQNTLDRYKQSGLKYYEFYADTDDRTCDRCAALDRKRFKLKQARFGVNCPPMHDGCRCCILAVID